MAIAHLEISPGVRTVERQTTCCSSSDLALGGPPHGTDPNALKHEATCARRALLIREREYAASARIEAELARMQRK